MYLVVDNLGTRKVCWTMKKAIAWLPFCGKRAFIIGRWTRRIYHWRIVE